MFRFSICILIAIIFNKATGTSDGGGLVPGNNENMSFPLNCSSRSFCSNLRTRFPTDREKYLFGEGLQEDNVYYVLLNNSLKQQLVIGIQSIENYQFRLTAEEPSRHRYKLQYVLDKEPVVEPIQQISKTKDQITLTYKENKKARIQLSPLKIEFYHGIDLQAVIDGDRIIMENTPTSQAFAFNVRLPEARRFFGLHEHADYFNLRHTADLNTDPYRLRNTDYGTYAYEINSTKSMYGSVPLLYGFGPKRTSAIFVHNAAEMFVDIDHQNRSAYFMVNGGTMDVFVLLGPSLKNAVRQYMNLTGKPHLPQRWTLGYHQCRVSYDNITDVKNVITNFDKNNFPLDGVWLVRAATDNQRWFTWNQTSFKNIKTELFDWADRKAQRKFTAMTESNIKVDPTYPLYTEGLTKGYFVKDSNGSNFENICWAGNSTWFDFFNPKGLEYYASRYLYQNFEQSTTLAGTWNDMGEPAIFDNLDERSLPYSAIHYGGVKHRDVHNIYGLMQVIASHKGLVMRDNGTMRPFILTRAGFAGTQRYAAKWSGDNEGIFEDLQFTIPMTMVANLAGINFYGADIPGFRYGATEELTIRWYQVGSWIPFFRAHAWSGPRREPYLFNNDTQILLREAMNWRYKHLFYWYTIFFEHTVNGDPIVRPVIYEYPEEEEAYDLNDQFLVGSDILVSSVSYSNVTDVQVYLPGKQYWIQVLDGKNSNVFKGQAWHTIPVNISFIPIFYREGSVIARYDEDTQSTSNMTSKVWLHAVLDENNTATGRIYFDDNISFEYLEKKVFLYHRITVQLKDEYEAIVAIEDLEPNSKSSHLMFTIEHVTIYQLKPRLKRIHYTYTRNGIPLSNIEVQKNQRILL